MIACMGGFCSSRETCSEYLRGLNSKPGSERYLHIVERLCSETEDPTPIVRVVKKEEREDATVFKT